MTDPKLSPVLNHAITFMQARTHLRETFSEFKTDSPHDELIVRAMTELWEWMGDKGVIFAPIPKSE